MLGAILGGVGLWLTLREVPPHAIRLLLSDIDAVLALAALGATLIALSAVVLRWRSLLAPASPEFGVLFRATVVGQMMNILLPIRGGELIRIWAVAGKTPDMGFARVAGSLGIEKSLDLTLFGLSSAVVASLAIVPTTAIQPVRWALVPTAAALALLGAVLAVRWTAGKNASPPTSALGRVREAVQLSISVLSTPAAAARIFGLSALVLVASASANQLLLVACGIDAPWWAGLLVLVVLQAGSVPPALPGRVGVYNYLTVLALGFVGIAPADAAAYSIALYVVAYLPKLILGAIFFANGEFGDYGRLKGLGFRG